MTEKPKELQPGDACPTCGGEFRPVKDAPVKDGTVLCRCSSCGYHTRFDEAAVSATRY